MLSSIVPGARATSPVLAGGHNAVAVTRVLEARLSRQWPCILYPVLGGDFMPVRKGACFGHDILYTFTTYFERTRFMVRVL